LSAGLDLADPYIGVSRLVSRQGSRLIFDGPDYELAGDPRRGRSEFNLNDYARVIVIGAAKGVQRGVLALEEILGDYLTGGHIIAKYGDDIICKKVGVTLAAHPVPDEKCVEGCKAIYEWIKDISPRDFVITIMGSGVSSLLTWPIDGVSLAEVSELTRLLQIERGALTLDLNAVRNHLDRFKGGRIARYLKGAAIVNLVTMDLGGAGAESPGLRNSYRQVLQRNIFLAALSDGSTFQDAVNTLYKYDVWEQTPRHIRDYFLKADPKEETVKFDEYEGFNARVFSLTPKLKTIYPAMYQKARDLGYTPLMLSESLSAEAKDTGRVLAGIALNIQNTNEPVKAPCVLISSGELVVTVGKETGVGGRNQEFCTMAALKIAGSPRIVIAAADTDGTDGPGGFSLSGAPACLAGAVVDGFTAEEAKAKGIDLAKALKSHGVSEPLWLLDSGIAASQSISVLDLRILLIMD
jgi:glycerate-2-kinase